MLRLLQAFCWHHLTSSPDPSTWHHFHAFGPSARRQLHTFSASICGHYHRPPPWTSQPLFVQAGVSLDFQSENVTDFLDLLSKVASSEVTMLPLGPGWSLLSVCLHYFQCRAGFLTSSSLRSPMFKPHIMSHQQFLLNPVSFLAKKKPLISFEEQ